MHILSIGLNHHKAPVEIREKYTIAEKHLAKACEMLRTQKSILEAVLLSTCNRTEAYVVADQVHTGRYFTKMFFANWFDVEKEEIEGYLDIKEDEDAVGHLFRVTCGLDSMIVGETQILGQVRDSFFTAQKQGTTGSIFHKLFQQAIALAKAAHTETAINDHPVSVSYAAVELARQIFGDLKDKQILVLGAGEMSELTLQHLVSGGAKDVTVVNRTWKKAQKMAEKFSGKAQAFEDLAKELASADIFMTSTAADHYVVTKDLLKKANRKRKGRPLLIIDTAVPRDVEPSLHDMDDVFLYDIDDLNGIVTANLRQRRKMAKKIEQMVEKECLAFWQWVSTLGVVPVISAVRQKALRIQENTMASLERKLPDLGEREKKVIRKHMKSVVNQMLRDPISAMKELATEKDREELLALLTKVFAVEEEVGRELQKQEACEFSSETKETTARTRPLAARHMSLRS